MRDRIAFTLGILFMVWVSGTLVSNFPFLSHPKGWFAGWKPEGHPQAKSEAIIAGVTTTIETTSTPRPVVHRGVESPPEVSPESSGEDWPHFQGPRRDGTSREVGLLKSWPSQGPPLLWSYSLGSSFSAPVISRGRLVLFHRLGMQEILECVDAGTGAKIWKQVYPSRYVDRYGYNGGPRSSPAIEGSRVYTFGAEGKLTCLDFENGKILWQRWINQDYRVPQNFFGVGTTPVIDGELILLNAGGSEDAGVLAVNKNTGKTVWHTSNDGASYSTPVVRTLHGKRLGIFFTREGLLAVEVQSGKEHYRYPFRSKQHQSVNAASPVVVENYVFLSATYNTGAVLLKLEPQSVRKIWKDRRVMQNHWATSIYHEGYLYGMDGRHEGGANLRCIELMTGEIRWTADRGLGRAAFIMADGHLITLGERGHLALVEVNPDRYHEKARIQILGYPCWTPPVLSHGLLYVRNENKLLCFDLRESSAGTSAAENTAKRADLKRGNERRGTGAFTVSLRHLMHNPG